MHTMWSLTTQLRHTVYLTRLGGCNAVNLKLFYSFDQTASFRLISHAFKRTLLWTWQQKKFSNIKINTIQREFHCSEIGKQWCIFQSIQYTKCDRSFDCGHKTSLHPMELNQFNAVAANTNFCINIYIITCWKCTLQVNYILITTYNRNSKSFVTARPIAHVHVLCMWN